MRYDLLCSALKDSQRALICSGEEELREEAEAPRRRADTNVDVNILER